MYQIDNATSSASMPNPAVAGTPGYFIEGSQSTGTAATIITADFLNMLMMELVNICKAGGVMPSKAVFNQLAAAIQSGSLNFGPDRGTANVYVVTLNQEPTTLTDGMIVTFRAGVANSGASTLTVYGLTPEPILGLSGEPLQGGEIIAGGMVSARWDAAKESWILLATAGGALAIPAGNQSNHAVNLAQVNAIESSILSIVAADISSEQAARAAADATEAQTRAAADAAITTGYQQADTAETTARQEADTAETSRAEQAEASLAALIALRATSSFTSGISFLIGDIRVLIGSGTLPNSGTNTTSVLLELAGFSSAPVVIPVANIRMVTSTGFNAVLAAVDLTVDGCTISADINEASGATINKAIPFSYVAVGKSD